MHFITIDMLLGGLLLLSNIAAATNYTLSTPLEIRAANGAPNINCDLFKNEVDCTGLDRGQCALRSDASSSIIQAQTCEKDDDKKRCCDGRNVIPFTSGVFYTGYMRACGPDYQLKKSDRPNHKWLSCDELKNLNYSGMDKNLQDLRSWETAGCAQASPLPPPQSLIPNPP
ncbi:hypothetical protein CDD81_7950 [Ophiocordyceps australis]|uniref:Cyanovirin-N domain-containing protein n=1 Tax=Ophiocordyceps australis TaxID=1399860 RepID=A0A2C5Y290_9HYPO|nr:hypothetical protein CDD81_7950 [Ophiocordyceps australis]